MSEPEASAISPHDAVRRDQRPESGRVDRRHISKVDDEPLPARTADHPANGRVQKVGRGRAGEHPVQFQDGRVPERPLGDSHARIPSTSKNDGESVYEQLLRRMSSPNAFRLRLEAAFLVLGRWISEGERCGGGLRRLD